MLFRGFLIAALFLCHHNVRHYDFINIRQKKHMTCTYKLEKWLFFLRMSLLKNQEMKSRVYLKCSFIICGAKGYALMKSICNAVLKMIDETVVTDFCKYVYVGSSVCWT